MKNKFAAQLYTLREQLQDDFPKVLRTLKEMGWEAVQIDGLHGYSPEEVASVLEETGLSVAGMHISLERMNDDLDAVLKEAKLFQTKDIFCHYLEGNMQNEAGYKQAKKELLAVANQLAPLGFRVGYHNHDFEFHTRINDEYALEYILQPEGDLAIYPEIDTYWVKKAGLDPLAFIKNYPHRIPILHLKDMTNDGKEYFAEIGTGLIDFEPILLWGEKNGVEYYAVEQDYCPNDPYESLQTSLTNLLQIAEKMVVK